MVTDDEERLQAFWHKITIGGSILFLSKLTTFIQGSNPCLSLYAIIFILYIIFTMKITIKGNSIDITITTDENCTVEWVGNVIPRTAISPLLQEHRKGQAIQLLKDEWKDTAENIKLINDVVYTDNAIIIWGVSWSYNNAKASDFWLPYTIDDENNPADYDKPHVFKGGGDYDDEDYFNYAMVDKIAKQGAKVPSYEDIWNSLVALPWDTKGKAPKEPTYVGWWIGVKILSILLGTEMSGYRDGGVWHSVGSSGYLWSRSKSGSALAWACGWDEARGKLDDYYRGYARPLRLLA